jgi:hypothetical protein
MNYVSDTSTNVYTVLFDDGFVILFVSRQQTTIYYTSVSRLKVFLLEMSNYVKFD